MYIYTYMYVCIRNHIGSIVFFLPGLLRPGIPNIRVRRCAVFAGARAAQL